MKLQSIRQGLVHPAELRRNRAIDGPVTNFNDQASYNVGVDLWREESATYQANRRKFRTTNLRDDFQLFTLAVLGFRDGCFEALDDLTVKFLDVGQKSAWESESRGLQATE